MSKNLDAALIQTDNEGLSAINHKLNILIRYQQELKLKQSEKAIGENTLDIDLRSILRKNSSTQTTDHLVSSTPNQSTVVQSIDYDNSAHGRHKVVFSKNHANSDSCVDHIWGAIDADSSRSDKASSNLLPSTTTASRPNTPNISIFETFSSEKKTESRLSISSTENRSITVVSSIHHRTQTRIQISKR